MSFHFLLLPPLLFHVAPALLHVGRRKLFTLHLYSAYHFLVHSWHGLIILSQQKQPSCQSSQDTSAEYSDSSLTSMQIIQVFSLLLGDPICCWHCVKDQCSDAHHSTSLGVQNYHSTDAVNFVLWGARNISGYEPWWSKNELPCDSNSVV